MPFALDLLSTIAVVSPLVRGLVFFAFIIGLILIVRFVFGLVARARKKSDAAWSQAADELGITFTPPPPRGLYGHLMEGLVEGFHVKVHNQTHLPGRPVDVHIFTEFRVSFPAPLELGLSLSCEGGLFENLSKKLGAQDIITGDQAFDDAFLIKGTDEDSVIEFLGEERRKQLLELNQTLTDIVVTDGELFWVIDGVVNDTETLVGHISELTRVAFILAGHLATSSEAEQ
jgi:hypothetical protein